MRTPYIIKPINNKSQKKKICLTCTFSLTNTAQCTNTFCNIQLNDVPAHLKSVFVWIHTGRRVGARGQCVLIPWLITSTFNLDRKPVCCRLFSCKRIWMFNCDVIFKKSLPQNVVIPWKVKWILILMFLRITVPSSLMVKMMAPDSFESSGITHPVTLCHITEQLNPECCRDNLKCCNTPKY